MIERWITTLHLEDAGVEPAEATRERLREVFPRSAARRMTRLGMLLGSTLAQLKINPEDTLVYASMYAETRALEDYLASFPTASPTLFQTSIHPSAVQQALIARRQPLNALFPLTGASALPVQALLTCLLAPAETVILCGGEERGTWLLDHGCASDRSYAYSAVLSRKPSETALARIALTPDDTDKTGSAQFTQREWFQSLQERQPFSGPAGCGQHLTIEWL